jgi:uncharacterized membrane protein YphA (DoxX/SURF4 family)
MTTQRIDNAWWALRLTFGLVAFLAGLDKFLHLLTNWDRYLAPMVAMVVPPAWLLPVVGLIEMGVGILILTRWTQLGAYVASAWLVAIAINLVLAGPFLDIAVRDLGLAVGAWTLGELSAIREPIQARPGQDISATPVKVC